MATKKEEQVKAAMAKVEAAKKAEAADTKTTAKKAPAKKATTTKAAEKKAPAKKATTTKTTAKKAPAKKAATTKTTAKKAPAKKTAAKKSTETVYVQCFGFEITTDDIKAKVAEEIGNKTVKELNIYVKPEEGMIYFTADGEQGSVNL